MAPSMALNTNKVSLGGPARPPTFSSFGFGGLSQKTSKISRSSVLMMASANVHELAGGEWKSHVLDESKNQPVIVDFTASWCGPCKMMAPKFDEAADKFEEHPIKFVKFDIDMDKASAKTAGIKSLPTVKVYKDGEEVVDLGYTGLGKPNAADKLTNTVELAMKK